MNKTIFRHGDRVVIGNLAESSALNGRTGTIVGTSYKGADLIIFIIELDQPMELSRDEGPFKAVCIPNTNLWYNNHLL